MSGKPIEIRATSRFVLGMSPAQFLRNYWQKQPLLIRGMFGGDFSPISPNDLAGLACEEAALSRIVTRDARRDRWLVRNGPFTAKDFAKLSDNHWTLLVQDVDKWDADVAALLERFSFIPSWRIDDVMISYATDGGGVGAHIDQYDVFLVQGLGQRRWRISTATDAPREFREDSELKLLRDFAPTHEWVLNPGDALYLPPGIAHDGVAIGKCMTYSIGMRAPAQAELLLDLAEFLAESLTQEMRYTDADLTPARASGEIDDAALRRVVAAIPQFAQLDKNTLAHWFGCFITRYRSAQLAAAPTRALTMAALQKRLPHSILLRNPFSRYAWRRKGRAAELFVAGDAWDCPLRFARLIAGSREIDGNDAMVACADRGAWQTLAALIDAGHVQLARRRRSA
jgi:50S ribosomal protein L16 3-hydroxylase